MYIEAAMFGCVGFFLLEILWANHRTKSIFALLKIWLLKVEEYIKMLSIFGVSTIFLQ